MKVLIVKGIIPKNIPGCIINDFEEEFSKYLRNANKYWRTREAFSLDFDSTLEDLKNSHFIYTDRRDIEYLIKKQFNVIEEL